MPAKMIFEFMDVGMGDCTLVRMIANGSTDEELALVDFGEKRSMFKVPYTDAMKYLVDKIDKNSKKRGKATPFVDYLFLTHPDGDHYNKIEELIDATYPQYPNTKLHFEDLYYSGNTNEYKGLIETLAPLVNKGTARMFEKYHCVIDPTNGPKPDFTFAGGDVQVYILSANYPKRNGATNPKSIVLMFECGGKKVILTGDAEELTEDWIIDEFKGQKGFLEAYALKLGHHGSKSASSPAWIDAVKPKAIFASGDWAWSHPYCETICRFINKKVLASSNEVAWYLCGQASEYFNNKTKLRIGMNLWYFVKTVAGENLMNDAPKKAIKGNWLETWGVQWELTVTSTGTVSFARTDAANPASKQKVPPPFDCSTVPLVSVASLDTLEEAFAGVDADG